MPALQLHVGPRHDSICAEHMLKVGAMLTKLVLPPTCLEDTLSRQC